MALFIPFFPCWLLLSEPQPQQPTTEVLEFSLPDVPSTSTPNKSLPTDVPQRESTSPTTSIQLSVEPTTVVPNSPEASSDRVETLDFALPDVPSLESTPSSGSPTPPPNPATPEPQPSAQMHISESNIDALEASVRGTIGLLAGYSLPQDSTYISPSGIDRVPYQRWRNRNYLYLALRVRRGEKSEFGISGKIDYSWASMGNRPRGLSSDEPGNEFRSSGEYSLYELFWARYWKDIVLKIGRQHIAWGNSDGIRPNDVLGAQDRRETLIRDSDWTDIPNFALLFSWRFKHGTFTLVGSPFLEPDRFDLYASPWAMVQEDAHPALRRMSGILYQKAEARIHRPLHELFGRASLSEPDIESASGGARLTLRRRLTDMNAYYHYGYDRQVHMELTDAFADQLERFEPAALMTPEGRALLGALVAESLLARNNTLMPLKYVRRHHVGIDGQVALGRFIVRSDWAYDSAKVLYSEDIRYAHIRPSIQGVVGAEFQTGSTDQLILVEAWMQTLLGDKTPNLLGYDRTSLALSALLKWSLWRDLMLETRVFYSILPVGVTAEPRIGYKRGGFSAYLGWNLSYGQASSYSNYFRRANGLQLAVHYRF